LAKCLFVIYDETQSQLNADCSCAVYLIVQRGGRSVILCKIYMKTLQVAV